MIDKNKKIFVAGHRGLAGSAIVKALKNKGYYNLLCVPHAELDLTNQTQTYEFFKLNKPDYVFLAAAKVGGIYANDTKGGEFIFQNLSIQTNVIDAAYKNNVQRLIFLGSSCIYPKLAEQPMKEEYLMMGTLEKTNSPYAIAKIAGIEMCRAYNKQYNTKFLCVMPTNMYGPNDNYDLLSSHVLPALIRKAHEAKIANSSQMQVWGSGQPRREFLFSEDMATACILLFELNDYEYDKILNDPAAPALINIGYGEDITIRELCEIVKNVVQYEGDIMFDSSKPDGTPRKLLDVSRLKNLGWKPEINLVEGIKFAYRDFLND